MKNSRRPEFSSRRTRQMRGLLLKPTVADGVKKFLALFGNLNSLSFHKGSYWCISLAGWVRSPFYLPITAHNSTIFLKYMSRFSKWFLPFVFGDKMFCAYHPYVSSRGHIFYVDLPSKKYCCYFLWVVHLFQHLLIQMEEFVIEKW